MKQKILGFALSVVLLAFGASAHAQQPTKIRRIGYLANTESTTAVDIKPLRERLKELSATLKDKT